jgi:hypothetical protein
MLHIHLFTKILKITVQVIKVLYLKNFGHSPNYSLLTPFLANFGLVRQSLKEENPGDRLLPPPPLLKGLSRQIPRLGHVTTNF